MGYLIGQILLCLLIAFVLGFIIGCLFCRCKRAESIDDTDWESRYERLKRDHAQLRSESDDWKSKYTALAVAPMVDLASDQSSS